MKIHFAHPGVPNVPDSVRRAAGLPTHAECGARLTGNEWTSRSPDVTCLPCLFRIGYQLQTELGMILTLLGAQIESLKRSD